jgi:uncharacterized protein YcfL
MKKVVLSLIAVAMLLVVSCGPSAKEIEEKRIADSIIMADSIAMVQAEQQKVADSIATADSIKVADSIAKIKPAKKK